MFICIIIFGIWCNLISIFASNFIYIYTVCFILFVLILLFSCAESTIGDIPESTMTSVWRRSLPPSCPSSPSYPSPTSWCVLPTPSTRVQRRPVVRPAVTSDSHRAPPTTFDPVIYHALGSRAEIQVGFLIYYCITLFLLSPDRAGEGVISKVGYCSFTRILLGSGLSKLWTL